MKKLFKKKISLFGKEISMFAVVVVAMIAIASAALVPYLSNVISGEVTVSSPLEFSDVSSTDTTCTKGDSDFTCTNILIHGGESFSVTQTISNKASVLSPEFYTVVEISNLADPKGLTLMYHISKINGGDVSHNTPSVGNYTNSTGTTFYYFGYANGNVYPVSYTETGTLTVTTAPNFAPGIYNIKAGTVLRTAVPGEAKFNISVPNHP